jgi:hypothetical protein
MVPSLCHTGQNPPGRDAKHAWERVVGREELTLVFSPKHPSPYLLSSRSLSTLQDTAGMSPSPKQSAVVPSLNPLISYLSHCIAFAYF